MKTLLLAAASALLWLVPAAARAPFAQPSVHMLAWFPRHDVRIEMIPRRPHANEELTLALSVIDRASHAPLEGPLTVAIEREGLFGRRTPVFPEADVRHDAGFPGEYTVRATPPTSGLYHVRVASRAAGARADAEVGFGVWPAGFNRWVIVPVLVLCGLGAFAVGRSRRFAAGNPAS